MATWLAYPTWLNPGDNAWQMTAATLVGLMSVPGLVVLYGGVMQKRWSVNSMMLAFVAFALVLMVWVLFAFKMAFGNPMHILGASHGFLANIWGKPGSILSASAEEGQAVIPLITTGPPFHFPTATLAYFQFVFAAITPILMLGSVLGRVNFKAWIPFVVLWSSPIYTINAFGICLSRLNPFRRVDDTLGVIYTHGFAGLAGGLLTGIFADPKMVVYLGQGQDSNISVTGLIHGNGTLLKEQLWAALFVIGFSAIGTFVLLKLVGLVVPLRMSEADMEEGDLAVHGHEVYPSDVPSLGFPGGVPGWAPSGAPAQSPG